MRGGAGPAECSRAVAQQMRRLSPAAGRWGCGKASREMGVTLHVCVSPQEALANPCNPAGADRGEAHVAARVPVSTRGKCY